MPRNPHCSKCPLHETANTICVWGSGNTKAKIMLVGEAPGASEDEQGAPFVGAAGKVLDRALEKAGLTRDEIYISNINKCKTPSNRVPTILEQTACFPYLIEEITTVHPRVVVALGATAMHMLTGKTSLARSHGTPLPPAKHLRTTDITYIGTYHPAAYLHSHNPSMLQALIDDLTLAASIMRGDLDSDKLPTHQATILPPGYAADVLTDALAPLRDVERLAADCEWSAPPSGMAWKWTKGAELFSLSLSGRTSSTEVTSVGLAWPPSPEARTVLIDFLRAKKLIFHNAMADLIWLLPQNLPFIFCDDTMVLAHLINEEQELKLSTLAQTLCGIENWKQPLWSLRPQTQEIWHSLLSYNVMDTFSTLLVCERLKEKLSAIEDIERKGIIRAYTNLYLPVIPTFVRMALTGMPLNAGVLAGAIAIEREKYAEALSAFSQLAELPSQTAEKVASSPLQVKHLFARQFNLHLASTDKTVLEELSETNRAARLILDMRHCQKLLGTYLEPWQSLITEQGDRRLHTIYRLTGARTGRTTAEVERGGSLQLVPREKWIRQLFRPQPGRQLYTADYSQMQLRIVAWLANDKNMLRIYNEEDGDLHTVTAAKIARVKPENVTKAQRQASKGINFGMVFMLGPEGLKDYAKNQYHVDMTIDEAYIAHREFFELYPGVKIWHKYCEEVVFPRGYADTPFGIRRHTLVDARKAANTPVQTIEAVLILLSIMTIDKKFRERPDLEAKLIGFVHDSVEVEGPDDHIRAGIISEIIRDSMEHPPTHLLGVPLESIPVPFKAEVHTGKSWGDAE